MDCEAQILYVSGGRVVDGDWDSPKYSGMYSYNVRTSKWKLLQRVSSLLVVFIVLIVSTDPNLRCQHHRLYSRSFHPALVSLS
jgi:hypothetical protein